VSRARVALLALLSSACGDFSADPVGQAGSAGMPAAGAPGGGGSSGSSPASGTGGGGASAAGGAATGGGGSGAGGRQEPPKATCTDVTACGGDVAGVWFASSSCLPLTSMADIGDFGLGCKEVAAKGKLEVSGNWTLNADGTMSDNTTTTGDVEFELQAECLNISGTVTQCDRVPAQLESIGLKDPMCVDSTTTTGGCTCKGTINQMGSMAHVTFDALKMGKYATASNKLTTMGIDSVEYDYCVQGEILTVTPKPGKDLGQLNGTVVFQKQQ
jgi:hypothetical protein